MKFPLNETLSYEETVRFHGHNGPFLALGYRLGQYLNEEFNPQFIKDFDICVYLKQTTPYTCLLDGLQCSTCATLGKGNIKTAGSPDGGITVSVGIRQGKLLFEISEEALKECLNSTELIGAAERINDMPEGQLWKRINY